MNSPVLLQMASLSSLVQWCHHLLRKTMVLGFILSSFSPWLPLLSTSPCYYWRYFLELRIYSWCLPFCLLMMFMIRGLSTLLPWNGIRVSISPYHLIDMTEEWDGGNPVAAWIYDGILPSLFSDPHCYKLLGVLFYLIWLFLTPILKF